MFELSISHNSVIFPTIFLKAKLIKCRHISFTILIAYMPIAYWHLLNFGFEQKQSLINIKFFFIYIAYRLYACLTYMLHKHWNFFKCTKKVILIYAWHILRVFSKKKTRTNLCIKDKNLKWFCREWSKQKILTL